MADVSNSGLSDVFVIDALVTPPVTTGEETSQAEINAVIAPLLGDSIRLYKSEYGGREEGSFAGNYETTFTGPDPNGALIEWSRGGFIGQATHLLVKDGNADPAWYLFDMSAWDGKATIELVNFWNGPRGAISHVTIYGPKKPSPPPEPKPDIDVEKAAGEVTRAEDGSFAVPFAITVTNTGDEPLVGVQLTDDLDIFGSGELLAVEQLTSETLSINPGYDGLDDQNLLDGKNTLAPGEDAEVTFTVRFDPGDETGPFSNKVKARASGETSGEPVTDSDTVSFDLPSTPPPEPNPAIDVEKAAGEVTRAEDGSYAVPFAITVTNTGDEPLVGVQLTDSLDIFGSGALLGVEDLASATLSVNAGYDGLADENLLNGADTLAPGEVAEVTFTVRFDPGDETGPFFNKVKARASGETSGERVSDSDSVSFDLPPTPPPEPNPAIAVEKEAGEVTRAEDGSYAVPFAITVTNTGDEPLVGVQLTDSLDIFGTGELLGVEDLASATLSVNAGYDGLADQNLLDGTDILSPGELAEVTFTVRFDPGDDTGPFSNKVKARASGETSGEPVTDSDSVSFELPPTPPPEPNPAIDVEKSAGEVARAEDGSFVVPFAITVKNTGDEPLVAVQLTDSLDIFGNGALIGVEDLASATLSVNAGYDGLADQNLLDGADTLAAGEFAELTFTVRFDPGDETGPFSNRVTARASGEKSGELVSDSDTVSFELPTTPPPGPNPAIDVEKAAGEVTQAEDGSYAVPFAITVTNTGDEPLVGVQLTDSLDIFGSGELLGVENLASATLSVNAGYDGLVDQNLLDGADTLAPGEVAEVTFTVRFDPGAETGPFSNRVQGRASGETSGELVSDSDTVSFDLPTTPPPGPNPAIDVEKTAGEVTRAEDGSFAVPFAITVTNTGDEPLVGVQLTDSLNIFGTGELLGVENLASATLSVNAGYDGLADRNLLDGADALAVGEAAELTFTALFDPGDETGPFSNRVMAGASGETSGEVVTDSDTVSFELPTTPPPEPNPAISLEKTAGEVTRGEDGSFSVRFALTVTNTGDELLVDLQLTDNLDIFGSGELLAVQDLTSETLNINPGYDGLTDQNLLDGTDGLVIGESAELTFTVRFDPGDENGPFSNLAATSASGETSGEVVSDSDTVSFDLPPTPPPGPNPAIDVETTALEVIAGADGSYTVPLVITVTNTGDESLVAVQLTDRLDIFGSGELLAVEELTSETLSVNPGYDGLDDQNLLDGTDGLAPGESAEVTLTIRFDPGDETGPFSNETTASATGADSGELVTDSDTESFTLPVTPPPEPNPAISLEKTAGEVTRIADGSFIVPFALTVTNTGDEPLVAVQLTDSLDIFGTGELLAVEPLTSGTLSVNPGYDGLADQNLLDGTDGLALGESAELTFTVRFNPGDESGPFSNLAATGASGETSGEVVSDSDTVSFELPTTPPPGQNPAISLEKTAGEVTRSEDGSFTVPFVLTLTNTGDEPLVAVQLTDSLDIFGSGEVLAVEQIASGTLSINSGYDGLANQNLLDGSDGLAVGESAELTFTVRFNPGDETGPFSNLAAASASGETSGEVVSDSDTVSFELPTTPPPEPNPAINVEKAAGEVTRFEDGSFAVPFAVTVTNTGDEPLVAVQLTDSLDIFGTGELLAVEQLTSATLSVNTAYDGLGDQNLLAGTDGLAPGESADLSFTVRFNAGDEDGPFSNLVTARASGETSGEVVSDSDAVSFDLPPPPPPPEPAVTLEKTVGSITEAADGNLEVTFSLTVSNTGAEPLTDLQITDDLDIFGEGSVIGRPRFVAVDPRLSENPAYDGDTDTNLLIGTDALALGEDPATIEFVVRFNPKFDRGPFTNRADVVATGEVTGTEVSDAAEAEFTLPRIQSNIAVTKVVDRPRVTRGGLAIYEITVTNLGDFAIEAVQLVDRLPPGFQFVGESLRVIYSGPDGEFGTTDDPAPAPFGATGVNQVEFDEFTLGPGASVRFRYMTRVGIGTANGQHVNTVTITPGFRVPRDASAVVEIVDDPIFEKTTVIGKVFNDRDEDGWQDPDEPGIPGVRLATVSGLTMETDAYGRYHLADVDVDRLERGGNFIIKLDVASLPTDPEQPNRRAKLTTENPRVIRLTSATMSKIDFGVRLIERDTEPCFRSCVTVRRKEAEALLATVEFEFASVDSAELQPGSGLADALRAALARYDDTWGPKLFFTGHTDDVSVGRGLAITLATDLGGPVTVGKAGNLPLSVARARRVCRYVREEVGIPVDCNAPGVVSGMGFSQPLAGNNPDRNRRVDIRVRYYEPMIMSKERAVSPANCADPDVGGHNENWYDQQLADVAGTMHWNGCSYHRGPQDNIPSAEARGVVIQGGKFGDGMLIAETLPGRTDELPTTESEVTIYATGGGLVDEGCSDRDCGPVTISTEDDSELLITSSGDVKRQSNAADGSFEHIVVTPYRDESDNSVISAIRIMNDGIEPVPGIGSFYGTNKAWGTQFWSSGDPFVIDPRLDVLALDQAALDNDGRLADPVRFAVYTNYPRFIDRFRLEFFNFSASGPVRLPKLDREFTNYKFGQPLHLFAGAELSGVEVLGYVLRAYDEEGHEDVTAMRLLQVVNLEAEKQVAATEQTETISEPRNSRRDEKELWGKSNLEEQRIPIDGGRVRVFGVTASEINTIKIDPDLFKVGDDTNVPVGEDRRFVFEDHRPFGDWDYRLGGSTGGISDAPLDTVSADANEIRVYGGLFGCDEVMIDYLPGLRDRGDTDPPYVTVVADLTAPRSNDAECPDDVFVKTREGTKLQINATGDVRPVRYPKRGENFQQIVVTPYRDYTDGSVISALRIANEGIPYTPDPSNPWVDTASACIGCDQNFLVALANLTIGANHMSGNEDALAVDDHFDGSTFVDGRLAFYGKRRTENYLLTAQLDSTEDELKDFTDNLKRKDPRRIFRQLDPDTYYPLYGDDSTTSTDVDTQGAFYLRVDWDKNTALWGNFNTGMTDTEFLNYNRSLYGASFRHESQEATEFGDARTEIKLFASEAQSAAAHVTFRATGGSLYYLRDTDIVQGSEKVWIEVRRRDTEQVVEREVLYEGRDYEIDAFQGRLILRRPLSQVVNDRGPSIIRSTPLEGDEVYLLVDYEYVPELFEADDMTFGGRGKVWLGDHLAVGATKVTDQRDGTDYDLDGVDLTFRAAAGTYLSGEFGRSSARQNNANLISFDGGLSFQTQMSTGPGDSLEGDAIALEGRIDFTDFDLPFGGDMRAWSKERDAGFSTGRLGQGTDINDRGVELQARIWQGADGTGSDNVSVSASYTDFEQEQISREQVSRVQANAILGQFRAGLELRHEKADILDTASTFSNLNAANTDGEALLMGARLGYEVNDGTTVYAAAQTVTDEEGSYAENDLVSAGVNWKLNERSALSLEASDGDRGSALTAGLDLSTFEGLDFNLSGGVGSGAISQFASRYSIAEGHELYGSYAVDPDRTEGARNLLTLGQRRSLGNKLSIFTESQFGKTDSYANAGHVFGLNFDQSEEWRLSASLQFSEVEEPGIAFERTALSLGSYVQREDLKLSSRVEYREDKGPSVETRQYVSSNSFTHIASEDWRWLGQLNLSWTDDVLNGGRDARFVEFDLGYAWRPAAIERSAENNCTGDNDCARKRSRLNVIGKYAFLYDLPSEGQATNRPDEKSHVLSIEGIYDLNSRWELAAKLAIKRGSLRLMRDSGPWIDFGPRLASIRARYHLTHKLDGLAEYRWVTDTQADTNRHGALLGIYQHVGDNFKIGVGYNFTDFDDRLRIDRYENHGWFVDFVGKY